VNVTPAQLGRYLDIDATLKPLTRQIQSLADGTVPLVMVETPPAILDVSQQADLARSILNQNLVLTLPEGLPDQQGPWTFDPPTLARMLTFERVEDASGARYQVSLNSTELRQFLTDLAPKLSQTPRNTHFTFNDETSQLEVIQPAVIGRVLDVDGSIRTIQENLYAAKHTVPLVFITTPPPVTDQMTGEQLGITELVHVEYSYFFGSGASRVQNIKIAASSFHGLLIAPGETFSMASVMGDISLDNGYAEAMIIMNGRTIKGVGGGVCQVSTTLFRAAFFSGFPIVERQPHAYRVSYYERRANGAVDPNLAGLDATVFVPLVDLKFTNDTPYWLLMETYVSEARQQITWKFYSTKDGRNVEWTTTGPENIVPAPEALYKENPDLPQGEVKQVDWTADGADVTVDRKVYKDGNVYLHDVITTHYEPWQAIYEYGPGTEGMPPPPSQ
jgi:vancomycin resistance protein YoaR